MTTLSADQIASYHEHGYLLIPKLIDSESLARYDARFLAFVNEDIPPAPEMTLMKDVMIAKGAVIPETPAHAINKLLSFEDDPELYDFARHPELLAAAQQLVAHDELYTLVTNVFNKPPNIDGRHPLHQDLRYFRVRPADGIVAAWTAISPATRQSGCLAVVPGTHTGPLLDHKDPDWEYVNFAFYGVDTDKADERIYIEMQPGDTLFFHPLLIHGSGRNQSDGFRRSISTHYARADCTSDGPDWRNSARARAVSPR